MKNKIVEKANMLQKSIPHQAQPFFTEMVECLPPDKHGTKLIQCDDCKKCYLAYSDGEPEFCPYCGS